MAGEYFADTFYWVALTYPRDSCHQQVVSWQRSHPTARLVTTEEVLAEVLTWFAALGATWRAIAADMVERTLANNWHKALPPTRNGFRDAVALYKSRLDKEYSLLDCRSMRAMKSLRISEVLSNDRHFGQEGGGDRLR
jgi:predicted nucleic acid-binding protein